MAGVMVAQLVTETNSQFRSGRVFSNSNSNTNTFSSNSNSFPVNSNNGRPRGRVITVPLPKDGQGNDVYPDCSRGKVCLPVAEQCARRQTKVGASNYDGKTYWFNWQSSEQVLRNATWNWFTA